MQSNCRPNLFSSYLSNNEEYAKRDHMNEFRGSTNWEGGMGRPGMAEKQQNPETHSGGRRRRVRRPDLGASGSGSQ